MNDLLFKVTQVVGTMGAACLSGYIACFSQASVPTLSVAPVDVLVKQFKTMYGIGSSTSPPFAIIVTLCNVFSAYHSRKSTSLIGGVLSPSTLYTAAAICVPSIVPFTLICMHPGVNKELLELGAKAEKGVKAEGLGVDRSYIDKQMIRWRGLNFIRATAVGLGALIATVASIA